MLAVHPSVRYSLMLCQQLLVGQLEPFIVIRPVILPALEIVEQVVIAFDQGFEQHDVAVVVFDLEARPSVVQAAFMTKRNIQG